MTGVPVPSLAAIDAELARRDLRTFVGTAWPIVEPATPFVPGWHLDAICAHLEAVTRGQIRNLLINMPPRHMKSLLVSVFWPAWEWATAPARRWLYASYALSLSIRDSVKCRRLIESPWYQRAYGRVYQLTGDQNVKVRYDTDQTGYRIATSVGGGATGEGGDRIVVDDPHNVQEAHSDLIREATRSWWAEIMAPRLNDPRTGARVIVMQRCHERDLAGVVLEQGGYEQLVLPAEYDGRRTVTSLGWADPRQELGALLWPARFAAADVADLKRRMGSYAVAGQLQQRPAPAGGGLFQRQWFPLVEGAPVEAVRVRAWDKAATGDGGDWTVGVRMARDAAGLFYVEDVIRAQLSSAQRNALIRQTAALDGPLTRIRLEQEPGSGGKESADISVRELAGYDVVVVRPTGDKATRARPFAVQAEAGNVRCVRGPWIDAYLEELMLFPSAAHDDQVDASADACNELTLGIAVPYTLAAPLVVERPCAWTLGIDDTRNPVTATRW